MFVHIGVTTHQDTAGELYLVDYSNDAILRLCAGTRFAPLAGGQIPPRYLADSLPKPYGRALLLLHWLANSCFHRCDGRC